MRSGLLVLLWLSLAAFRPAAQASEPRFARIDGVPRNVVASLAQDRAGFVWFGGGNGLTRYDGHRLQIVERADPDPARRSLGWVRALLAGSDGRLWIGTETDGIAVHDGLSGLVADVPYGSPGPSPTVLALAEDGAGGLWAGTAGAGLHHYTRRGAQLQREPMVQAAEHLPGGAGDRVSALLRTRDGALWVGSQRGLARRGAGGSPRVALVLAAASDDAVLALQQMADGRVWIGTQQGRLAMADADGGNLRWLADPGPASAVNSLAQDRDGTVWVGRLNGIDLRHATSGALHQRLAHDARRPLGLAGDEVTALLVDRAGSVWVGGLGLGLQRHDPGHRALQWRVADTDGRSAFVDADVRALLHHPDGSVWAATRGGDLVRFDPTLETATPLARDRRRHHPVRAMAGLRDGRVWLADGSALHLHAADGSLLRRVPHVASEVRQMMEHADGSLWLTAQNGVFRLAPGAMHAAALRGADGQPLRQQTFALAPRPDGAVWVGAVNGLFLAAADGSVVVPARFAEGAGLANPTVVGLLVDRSGRLWVDTAVTGLHAETGRVGDALRLDRVSLRHGATGHPFGANLLEDRRGRIWTHMSVYDPKADRLVGLTAADGAGLGTGWFGAYAATADGRLLFGSNRGVLAIDAASFEPHGATPPLVVAGLHVNGVRKPAGQLADGLRLRPADRSFAVELAGLDFVSTSRTRYRFRLDGFETEWNLRPADFRSASYGKLRPGDYRLQAQVAVADGPWSSPPLQLAVHVEPAWWQTLPAQAAALLLLAAALYGLVQWRTLQLRARQAELERHVAERTTALQAMAGELQRERAALLDSSVTDPLTGLRNRRFLAGQIEADTALARRRHDDAPADAGPPPADADLVFYVIDIDHFKLVNDLHGHAAGDAVLRQIRDRLRAVFRDSDHLVRWGGEEFLVVARGTSRAHAAALAERLRTVVADTPFVLDDGSLLHKTCSTGFCAYPLSRRLTDQLGWADTVQLADTALLAVKQRGRNGWLGLCDGSTLDAAQLQAVVQMTPAQWATVHGLQVAGR